MPSDAPVSVTTMAWETLCVSSPSPHVVHVELNRPKKLNAMNAAFWREFKEVFTLLATDEDCRAVVLSGRGKLFTAGLDITDPGNMAFGGGRKGVGRKALHARSHVMKLQDAFTAMERCPQPVLAACHSGVIGGGIDLVLACDMRWCSEDVWFQIKEVDIGLCADVGTLQRLPKVVGNESLVRELSYTARKLRAPEALRLGLVSRVCKDRETMVTEAIECATLIASKSPLAIAGTKRNLLFARDHTVRDGLEYVATWNASMLQSGDVMTAIMANMKKQKAIFSSL